MTPENTSRLGEGDRVGKIASYHYGHLGFNPTGEFWKAAQNTHLRAILPKGEGVGAFIHEASAVIDWGCSPEG